MRRAGGVALALAVGVAPGLAGSARLSLPGQAFCTGSDQAAREYVGAVRARDGDWLRSLRGCRRLAAGLRLTVLRTFPEPDGVAPVVKVRLGGKAPAAVGYTVFVALPR